MSRIIHFHRDDWERADWERERRIDRRMAKAAEAEHERQGATAEDASDCRTCSFYGKQCKGPGGWCAWK